MRVGEKKETEGKKKRKNGGGMGRIGKKHSDS